MSEGATIELTKPLGEVTKSETDIPSQLHEKSKHTYGVMQALTQELRNIRIRQ